MSHWCAKKVTSMSVARQANASQKSKKKKTFMETIDQNWSIR